MSALMPAARAVLLTWKSFGPGPITWRRGASSESRRNGPPTVSPTLASSSASEPAPTTANRPRREIVGSAGSVGMRSLRAAPRSR